METYYINKYDSMMQSSISSSGNVAMISLAVVFVISKEIPMKLQKSSLPHMITTFGF